ncbi:MAG TPA: elongation factor P, partial [Paenalcaligenes sp.]|nr:elongation factor P [Paenalcaligenes sp.]HLR83250.1 elongation factor P [Paenalcaligenes sp.]
MKTAQELRSGNIIEVNSEPMIIERAEYNKSGRNTAVVRLKLKNLLSGSNSEVVAKADDRYKMILLEKK